MDDEIHLIPTELPNVYVDAVKLVRGEIHLHGFRDGQTPEEYWAEIEAAEARARLGLPFGRAMPTEKEIAAAASARAAPG